MSGLFGLRAGLDAFFALALQQADSIEADFAAQSKEPEGHSGRELRDLAEKIEAQAERCGVQGTAGLTAVAAALEALDRARAKLYRSGEPELPDAKALQRGWEAAVAQLDAMAWVARSARAAGFPSSLKTSQAQSRLHRTAEHLALALQAAQLSEADRRTAAKWSAVAMAPDTAALETRLRALPPIRDLAEAAARLQWIDPAPGAKVPLPGVPGSSLRVKEWRAPLHGRRCFGPGGAEAARRSRARVRRARPSPRRR